MQWGKITITYFEEFLETINSLIEDKKKIVNVERIRRKNHVKSVNRTKINFYFRFLNILEASGYITQIGNKTPKEYLLPDTPINLTQINELIQ